MTRTAAAGVLWPRSSDRRAQGSLRTALWRLGRLLPAVVDVDRDRLSLCQSIRVDVAAAVCWATRLIRDDAVSDDDLDKCFAGNGELLPGWSDEWVLLERERIRQLRLHALETAAVHLVRRGRPGAAAEAALAAIQLEPLRESAHRTLIEIHLAEDNLGEAVRHVEIFRALIRSELGAEPSIRMTELISSRTGQLARLRGRQTSRRDHSVDHDVT